MKTLLLALTALISNSNQMGMDMHRRLEDDNKEQAQLFTIEKADIVGTKFSIAPVSAFNIILFFLSY